MGPKETGPCTSGMTFSNFRLSRSSSTIAAGLKQAITQDQFMIEGTTIAHAEVIKAVERFATVGKADFIMPVTTALDLTADPRRSPPMQISALAQATGDRPGSRNSSKHYPNCSFPGSTTQLPAIPRTR